MSRLASTIACSTTPHHRINNDVTPWERGAQDRWILSYCVLATKALSGRLNCSTVLSGERIICAVDHLLQDVVWRTWVPGRQNRESTKDLASEAGKAYADYMLKQRIVDQGVKSASGRHGGSFWVPTAFGKGIQLGTEADVKLSR